jgi:hypothetical protein
MQDILITTIQFDTDADEFGTVDGWHEMLNDLSADERRRFQCFVVERAYSSDVWFIHARLAD